MNITTEFAQESSPQKLLACMNVERIKDVKAAKDIWEHIFHSDFELANLRKA